MAVHRYTMSYPVGSKLPRDYFTNTLHFNHTSFTQTDLEDLADALCVLWRKWITPSVPTTYEMNCTVYDVDAVPNPPKAKVTKAGNAYTPQGPREVALCLSYYNDEHNKRRRGRIYAPACIMASGVSFTNGNGRPDATTQGRVLDLYRISNDSLPDVGGTNVQFGVWSRADQQFYASKGAWVDDEWDTMRSRGDKPTTRISSVRDG